MKPGYYKAKRSERDGKRYVVARLVDDFGREWESVEPIELEALDYEVVYNLPASGDYEDMDGGWLVKVISGTVWGEVTGLIPSSREYKGYKSWRPPQENDENFALERLGSYYA